MDGPTIDLSAGLEPAQSSSEQNQPAVDLSAGMEPAQSQGPVNPYARTDSFVESQRTQPGDLSNVPGADPGMQTPMAAGTAAPDPIRGNVLTPGGPAGKPIPGWDLSSHPGQNWHPVEAVKQVGEGVKNIAKSGVMNTAPMAPGSPVAPAHVDTKPNLDQAALGATQAMSGTMEATKPLLGAGFAAAPFRSALMYGAGIVAGKGAAATAKEMGATPNEQEFFHTLGFFLPDTMIKAAGFEMHTERQGQTERVGATAFGGKVGVTAARNPEAVGVAGHVGETKFAYAKPRNGGVNVSDQAPAGIPAPPPDPVAAMRDEQVKKTVDLAVKAQQTNVVAEKIAGLQPEGPPPPKPGEPGSKEMPAPAGMDDGALTQQTVEHVGTAIQALPPQLKPAGILETVKNLATWVAGKGTIVGPDNKLSQVTGQSPQAKDQSAKTIATKLVNDEVDRQNQKAQQAQDEAEANAEEQKKQAEERQQTQQEEEQAAIASTTEGGKPVTPKAGEVPGAPIPNTPAVQSARRALQGMKTGATAEEMDRKIRETASVTSPVRKSLVDEEIARRANEKEQTAENAMNGETPAHGLDRASLQSWADKVVAGEHPYVFVPAKSTFKPRGADELQTTKVKGSENPAFDGTYYHAKDIKPGDIRKAARDKENPQGALDAIERGWKEKQGLSETEEPDLSAGIEQVEQVSESPVKNERLTKAETALKEKAPAMLEAMQDDRKSEGWSDDEYAGHIEEYLKSREPEKPTSNDVEKQEQVEEKPQEPEKSPTTKPVENEQPAPKVEEKPEEPAVHPDVQQIADAYRSGGKEAAGAKLNEIAKAKKLKDYEALMLAEAVKRELAKGQPEAAEQPQETKPAVEFKPGQKVLVKQADGTEKERTVGFKHNNGRYVVKGEKKTIAADQMRPAVAKEAKQEENTSDGQSQPHPAGVDQTGGGRPSADSGSGDRGSLAKAPSEVPEVARGSEGADQENGAPVREGAPSVPEQGPEPGPGTGSDSGLDNSPAKRVIEKAKKDAAKPVVLNKDWFTHPDNWQVPGGEVTRLEGNLKALRILRDVEKNPRKLTDEEKQALANYVGWGALQNAFDPYKALYSEQRKWREAHQELQTLLSSDEFEAARRSTTNAHYTSPEIVRWMWDIAERFGFKGGNVLEPSMGVGNFFGMMPKSVRAKALAVGNELDPVTYGIAKLLYPGATLFNKDFKDLIIPDNEIDFAIGNVPFGDWSIYDPKYPKLKAYIHDYFMVKTLDKVKPGGVVAFITSTGTMDKSSPTIRNILASKADLVAAFRLPSTAFSKNAGTSVTTDLIILKKRELGAPAAGPAWMESPEMDVQKDDDTGTHPLNVNEYFQTHPENMLGKPVASTRMYGNLNFSLQPHDGKEMKDLLSQALKSLPKGIMLESKATGLDQASTAAQYAPDNILERQYVIDDKGNLKQRVDGKLVIPEVLENKDGSLNTAKVERMKAMVGVRGKLNDLLSDMVTLSDDEDSNSQIAAKRGALKETYDKFVKKYGLLNSPTNRIFQDDPHFPRLLALEHYDKAKRTSTPADIFTRRTIFPREPLKTISADPKEALQQILAERGFPDVNQIARLQGKEPKEVAAALVKQGLIFRDPEVGDYQTREKYLSGYVRDKLRAAETAVEQGMKEYEPNVEALKKVIPEDIEIGDDPATSVSVRPGATWIPLDAISNFFTDTFRTQANIRNIQGNWMVELRGRLTPELQTTFGTNRVTGDKLFEDCLNQRQTTVYDRDPDGGSTLNQKDTTLAQATQERIRQEFQKWSAHSNWTKKLTRLYNDAYNNLVQTEYDGSHLSFPGMNSAITLKSHQVNAVWRMLQDGRGLLAHEVGAGKTFEMAAAIMEGRRVGIFKKPMLAVLNSAVEQFRKEFLLLYPGANLLVPGEQDFDSRNRQRIMSHIATGDYDAIILPHSQFNLMDISPERQQMTMQREMDELEETIRALKKAQGERRTIKQLEKSKEKLRTSMAKLMDLKADKAINFDDTGVDALFVDEAHNYKNLSFYTKMNRVAGLQQAKAKSALRLKMKTEYLQDTHNGRGVIFATGTPVQNTMAELYTMIKYVAPDVLERAGIRFFDDWAANFGSTITAMELSADGRSYKARTKFARFQNVPELMQMFRSFADIKTAADLDLPRPTLETGKPIVITVPGSPVLESFVQDLMRRAERVRSGGVNPKVDNMLKVTTDGRKAATDMRLIDPEFGDDAGSKINTVVERMHREWQEGEAQKLTQIAFLDLYRTMDDADHEVLNLYNDMRNKLVGRGIPRDQIAVISEHDTRIKKQALFDKVNKGEVRLLLGSTQKMGAGINVQTRLKTLHHIDLTWRPGDLQQRDGRILRQGNENDEVRILTYLTEKSFDAYMAQTLQGKAEFISQIFSGRSKARVMVDAAADMVLSLEEMKIAASGNPDVKLKYDLEMQVQQLRAIERGFDNQKRDAKYQAEHALMKAGAARGRADQYQKSQDKVDAIKGEDGKGFEMKVDGKTFTDRKEGVEALKKMAVPEQNFWMDLNGIGISVQVLHQDGSQAFAYETSYGARQYPPDRTMESLFNSAEATIRNLSHWIETAKMEAVNAEADAVRFDDIAKNATFPEQAQLDKVMGQLAEVEKRLGLGNVNEGSQAGADAVTADASAEEPDKEPAEDEEEENDIEKSENPNSVWDALGSEEGSAVVPPIFEKAGGYIGKAAATTFKDTLQTAGFAGKSMKDVGREVVSWLYPRALMTEPMKDILGKAIGTPALNEFKVRLLTDGIDKMFEKLPEEAWTEFNDRFENGQPQPSKELQDAADILRAVLDGQNEEEQFAVNLGRPKREQVTLPTKANYLPHRYKVRPGQDEEITEDERLLMMANSRRPLEGSKAFLKKQKYSYREAIEAGAKPLGNPVKMVMKRVQEGSKFVGFKYMMHTGKKAGLITYLRQGQPMPPDYADVDDRAMQVWRPVETAEGGTMRTKAGRWIWQKDFARGINNYLSKDHLRGSKLGAGLVKLKNAQTEMRLSWSAFHWLNIGFETISSGMNIGLDKLYNQGIRDLQGAKALEGLADIGKSMIAPISMVKQGSRMMKFNADPDGFLETKKGEEFVEDYPEYPQLQADLFHGGLRVGMPDIYRESLGDGFRKDIAEAHLGKAVLKFFPWVSHMLMKPLFEGIIPRVKLSFAVQMYAHKLNQYSEALANGDVTRIQLARQVASAVDYRFGEMAFDNLYWNNTMRAATQFLFRSASWKGGSWMGAAKAGKEVIEGLKGTANASGFNDHIYDKVEDEDHSRFTNGARRFTRRLPELGINSGWLLGMGLTAAVFSSVASWLLTKTPIWQHAEDDHRKTKMPFLGALLFECMYPRTGKFDSHGEPVRFSFPSGLKDYVHAFHNPGGYAHGALSDVVANSLDTMSNRKPGPYGNYVYNPNDPAMRQLRDGLMYNLEGDFTPMSVSNWGQHFGPEDRASRVERAMGLIGGAPKEYDRSAALNLALELRPAHAPMTPEQEQASEVAREQHGASDYHRAKKSGNRDYLQRVFMQLSYPDAMKVYDEATPEEKEELRPLLYTKRVNAMRKQRAGR